MNIGQFLDGLQDQEVKSLVNDALERIPDRGPRLQELNQNPTPYFSEAGEVRREVELDDEFLTLITGVIEDDNPLEPISENTFIGANCSGTYASFLEQYQLDLERASRVLAFLDRFPANSALT